MALTITPVDLKTMLDTQATMAFIDVREAGEYNSTHIPGASFVPRRQLEFRMPRLVPYKGTTVVVCDDDGRRATLAANTLESMGYSDVRVLGGGTNRWTTVGYATEWGVNVPSKDFGEKMQVVHHIPEMHPDELQARVQRGEQMVILDSRTPEEHRRATIPGSRSAPGGELALHIADLVPDADTTVVVHCAGRTRSIIGARLLQRMGWRHVYDLKNGTMGWGMAGLELETGSTRLDLPPISPQGQALAEEFATRVADEDGVRFLSVAALHQLMARADTENVYLLDVRTEAEYNQGHIPGFQWFPGGQAVQRADDVVAVRNGHVVFACDDRVRAAVTASWYRQMGFPNVYVLEGGTTAWVASGAALTQGHTADSDGYDKGVLNDELPAGYAQAQAQTVFVTPQELHSLRQQSPGPVVIFVDSSQEFSHGHVPGAHWVPRGWLEFHMERFVPTRVAAIVVTCMNGLNSVLAAATLKSLGYEHVAVLTDGMAAWSQAGLPVERGLSGVMSPPTDVLPMGTDRNWADAMHYLRWEEELGKKYETHR